MNLQPTMNVNYYFAFLYIVMTLKTKDMIGWGCSIEPLNKVVVAGEEGSLTCSAGGESSVNSWRLGSNGNKGTTVYQSAVYRSDGTRRAPEFIAEGYYVIKFNESKIVLQMNETNLSQGGVYHCDCINPSSAGSANLAVLAPEPDFVASKHFVEGHSVKFTCSVSFNGTVNASFDISIKDSSESILHEQSSLPLLTNQNRYELTHNVTADPNVDQTFICSVKLIDHTSGNVLYSREKNATVQWKPVTSATIEQIDPSSCQDSKCTLGATIRCKAEGNPKPKSFQWLVFSYNGSQPEIDKTDKENLTLQSAGSFVYQCFTYNVIKYARHNATSDNFTVEVTEEAVTPASLSETSGAVVGAVIGVIALVGAIIVILAFLIHKKKISIWRVNDTGTIVERGETPPEKTHHTRYTNTRPNNGTRNDEIASDTLNKANKGQPPPTLPKKPTVVPKPQPVSNLLGRDTIVQDNELYGDRLSTAIERMPDPPPATVSTVSTDGNDTNEPLYSAII